MSMSSFINFTKSGALVAWYPVHSSLSYLTVRFGLAVQRIKPLVKEEPTLAGSSWNTINHHNEPQGLAVCPLPLLHKEVSCISHAPFQSCASLRGVCMTIPYAAPNSAVWEAPRRQRPMQMARQTVFKGCCWFPFLSKAPRAPGLCTTPHQPQLAYRDQTR